METIELDDDDDQRARIDAEKAEEAKKSLAMFPAVGSGFYHGRLKHAIQNKLISNTPPASEKMLNMWSEPASSIYLFCGSRDNLFGMTLFSLHKISR